MIFILEYVRSLVIWFQTLFCVVIIMSAFYELGTEFDIMRRLVCQLGFKGEDIEHFMAAILHKVNEVLRGEVDARSQV